MRIWRGRFHHRRGTLSRRHLFAWHRRQKFRLSVLRRATCGDFPFGYPDFKKRPPSNHDTDMRSRDKHTQHRDHVVYDTELRQPPKSSRPAAATFCRPTVPRMPRRVPKKVPPRRWRSSRASEQRRSHLRPLGGAVWSNPRSLRVRRRAQENGENLVRGFAQVCSLLPSSGCHNPIKGRCRPLAVAKPVAFPKTANFTTQRMDTRTLSPSSGEKVGSLTAKSQICSERVR